MLKKSRKLIQEIKKKYSLIDEIVGGEKGDKSGELRLHRR